MNIKLLKVKLENLKFRVSANIQIKQKISLWHMYKLKRIKIETNNE